MTDSTLEVRLLGAVSVRRNGVEHLLPQSRKVRALLGYLALSAKPVGRSRLCDLLWDVPNDPRGELRWCLSKLRGVFGAAEQHRLITTDRDLVALDLGGCLVDALEVEGTVQSGVGASPRERLVEVCNLFSGDLLDGLQVDGNPEFNGWLTAQRHRFRAMHIALVQELIRRSPPESDEGFFFLQKWLQLAPFDPRAHQALLEALVQCGRLRDAEEHLAVTIRSFEHEGLDWLPLRENWRITRETAPLPLVPASTPLVVPVSPPAGRRPQTRPGHSPAASQAAPTSRHRASVAVMPFVDDNRAGGVGDGLTEDIITRLAKLRVLFVIARGSVYALSDRQVTPEEAGRILNVDYLVSGSARRTGLELSVRVELAETRESRIVWTDELHSVLREGLHDLDGIVDRIVAAIADEIETAERNRAVLKPPSSLDAWEAYHRGLWHMYKFNGEDNRHAESFFRTAVQLDPTFARAYAGLSFTHFQNAFLELTRDRDQQIEQAFTTAHQSLGADDRDPAAHWAMGRALWLRGAQGESVSELQRSIDLSPNFALGHYTLGFVHSQSGDPRAAIDATNYSRQLSPFDPLQFAMLASRALAHVRLGEFEDAAHWAVKATARPNAHTHILAIATECLLLANRREEAERFASLIRARLPGYSVENFLRSFRFAPETEKLFRQSARQIGFG